MGRQAARHATDDNILLLKIEMGAGHGGPSGRYDAWRDEAMILAWIVTTANRRLTRRHPNATPDAF